MPDAKQRSRSSLSTEAVRAKARDLMEPVLGKEKTEKLIERVNALDAMDASERTKELVLRTRGADGEVILDVTDTGPGIPTDKLRSIFEPFFTTKKTGLGMGLSLSRTIVNTHNGRLWAENNSGSGATLHMALPAAQTLSSTSANPAQTKAEMQETEKK